MARERTDQDFNAGDHEPFNPHVANEPRAGPSTVEGMARNVILDEHPTAELAEQNQVRKLYGLKPLERDAMDDWLDAGIEGPTTA